MDSDFTDFVRRDYAATPPYARSRLTGAMHRLEDLLGVPTRPAGRDLIARMQRDLIVVRWLARAIQQLDRDSVVDPGCLDLSGLLYAAMILQGYVEGELLIPALCAAGAPSAPLSESAVLRSRLTASLHRLRGVEPIDPLFVARTRMLARLTRRHAEHLEGTIFPLGRRLIDSTNRLALGNRYATLRTSLYSDSARAGNCGGDARHGAAPTMMAH